MSLEHRPEKHVAGFNPAIPLSGKPMRNIKETERRTDSGRRSGALVYGEDEAVAHLVAGLIEGCAREDFGGCTAIGVADGDALIGGFVFHNYNAGTGVMEVSFAGACRGWLTRRLLHAAFSYVFDELACQLAVARTPAGLTTALRIAKAYGFEQVRVPRLFGRHEDGIISTLTAEAWRSNGFHKENAHGQEIEQGAEAA